MREGIAECVYIARDVFFWGVHMRVVILAGLLLSGCASTEVGSFDWFESASQPELEAYFQVLCEEKGVPPNTERMTQCVANDIESGRDYLSSGFPRDLRLKRLF